MNKESSLSRLRIWGLFIIIFSAVISETLANTVDTSHYELGALYNLFGPVVLGLITLIVYGLTLLLTKNELGIKIIIAISSLYNLYVGLALHLEKDYWPFVVF